MTQKAFDIHPKLVADSHPVGETDLCSVLLSSDSRYAWVILVPRRDGMRELHDLTPDDQMKLTAEVAHIAAAMQKVFGAGKTNVAALGNMVPQLHIHIVMRNEGDPAWPGPIWGAGEPQAYDPDALRARLDAVRSCLP